MTDKPDFKKFLENGIDSFEGDVNSLKSYLEDVWEEASQENHNQKRDSIICTGKGGVILVKESLFDRPLTQEEKDSIENGLYEIDSTGKNGFINYLGSYDSDMPDGYNVVRRDGSIFLEEWEASFRKRKVQITEQEFEKLKEERNGNNSKDRRPNGGQANS